MKRIIEQRALVVIAMQASQQAKAEREAKTIEEAMATSTKRRGKDDPCTLALRSAWAAIRDGALAEAAGYLVAARAWLFMEGTCLTADPIEATG